MEEDEKHTYFIQNRDGEIALYRLPLKEFKKQFNMLNDYSVERAAQHLLNSSALLTPRAAMMLRAIIQEQVMSKTAAKSVAKTTKSVAKITGKAAPAPAKKLATPEKGQKVVAAVKAKVAATSTNISAPPPVTKKSSLPGPLIGKLVNPGKTSAKAEVPVKVKDTAKAANTTKKEPAAKRESAAQAFKDLILEGKLSDDKIFAAVQKKFSLGDEKRTYVAWYRNFLKKSGVKVPKIVE